MKWKGLQRRDCKFSDGFSPVSIAGPVPLNGENGRLVSPQLGQTRRRNVDTRSSPIKWKHFHFNYAVMMQSVYEWDVGTVRWGVRSRCCGVDDRVHNQRCQPFLCRDEWSHCFPFCDVFLARMVGGERGLSFCLCWNVKEYFFGVIKERSLVTSPTVRWLKI